MLPGSYVTPLGLGFLRYKTGVRPMFPLLQKRGAKELAAVEPLQS